MTAPIKGWLTANEAEALRLLAADRVVLELGAWHGRSTIAMAQVAERVYTIDHFRGDEHVGAAPYWDAFWANIEQHGVASKVIVLRGDQADVLPALNLAWFDLIYYDSDHSYDGTKAAICRAVRSRAVVAVHDYHPGWPHVIQAVDSTAAAIGRRVRVVDTLAILERRSDV